MPRMGGVLLLTLLLALILAAKPAEAQSIRVSCEVYATNHVDPIAHADHLHRQIGNTSTTNDSTADSLYANKDTSCNAPWWTSAGWYPVERYEPNTQTAVYYRAPGDQTKVRDIPHGLQMIGKHNPTNGFPELFYGCGGSPGKKGTVTTSPPYGCTSNWGVSVRFPRCYDGSGVLTHERVVYGQTRMSCPASHPYMLPEIEYLVMHRNLNGMVPNPLTVSMDTDEWGHWTMMHADYFFAAQDEFHQDVDRNGDGLTARKIWGPDGWGTGYNEEALIDLCLREAPDALEYNHERCRAGGLLPWHERAIRNHYN